MLALCNFYIFTSLLLSIYLSVVNFSNWQGNLIITTLKVRNWNKRGYCESLFFQDAAKPVTELPFPSVTICSPGLNMEAVKEALLDDFEDWLYKNDKSLGNRREQLDLFMKEKYATRVLDGNFFDRIKEMNTPASSSRQEGGSRILHKMAACPVAAAKTDNEASISRRKRSNTGAPYVIRQSLAALV